jgi:hypothetical protein
MCWVYRVGICEEISPARKLILMQRIGFLQKPAKYVHRFVCVQKRTRHNELVYWEMTCCIENMQ